MYRLMKTLLQLLLVFCIAAPALSAPASTVSLRMSRQDTTLRIVFESDEETVRNLSASTSLTQVKIDFAAAFELVKQNEMLAEVTRKDRSVVIQLKNAQEVRGFKLSQPARYVVEVKTAPAGAQPKDQQKPAAPVAAAAQQKEAAKPQPAAPAAPQAAAPAKPAAADKKPDISLPEKPLKLLTIVLDAGHGGFDTGLIQDGMREKDITLSVVRDLSTALSKRGHKVTVTRKADQHIPLSERMQAGGQKKPDILLGIHGTDREHFSVVIAKFEETQDETAEKLYGFTSRQRRFIAQSRALAKAAADALQKEFGIKAVIQELPVPALASANSQAMIVELPFKAKLSDPKSLARIAAVLSRCLETHEQ